MRNLDNELEKLIRFANENDNIRGLVLQGSYINENASIDIFSDLDPLFYCNDVTEFTESSEWKNNFGKPISFFHDEWDSKDNHKSYTRLTIYDDGFKSDFGFADIKLAKYANDMPLYKVYVDKDNVIPMPDVVDEQKFYVKKPTEKEFQKVLIDFFFDTSYIVKTIYRDELFFQKYMENILHTKINSLLDWYIAIKYDFKVNVGHTGRYYKKYLSKQEWEMLERSYNGPCKEASIRGLLASYELVRYLGSYIALNLGFNYPQKINEDMYNYCTNVIERHLK